MTIDERYKRTLTGLRLELDPSIVRDVERTIELLLQDRERQARIDEVRRVIKIDESPDNLTFWEMHKKRLEELEAEGDVQTL